MTLLAALALAIAAGGALAWWGYRDRLDQPLARLAGAARATGVASLVILLLNPPASARLLPARPLVLIDNSISMHSAGGRAAEARALAASMGDTTTFGELARGEPGGHSALLDVLPAALASGRQVTIVTDGEIADADAIPPDQLAALTVRVVARHGGDDVALVDVSGSERLAAGDSLRLVIEAQRFGVADSAAIEVREGATVLLRGTIRFGPAGRGRITLAGTMPPAPHGLRWLELRRVGAPDAEADDDVRWWPVRMTATPGIVVIAVTPDWDGRSLYRTLRDVTEAPVRGYVQLQPGQWRRMDDLCRVTLTEVQAAARGADLLAVRGEIEQWQQGSRARLLWPVATTPGDWYLTPTAASPLVGALAGVTPESLPPAVAIRPLAADLIGSWVGATARLARRGSAVPVIGGRDGTTGRTITIGADGLHRWGFRGGASEQAWRSMVAEAAAWLLAAPDSGGALVQPVALVTQRGRPVRFRSTGTATSATVAIVLTDSIGERRDSLRFDGSGEASIDLPVGRYRYVLATGGGGMVAVEPYSEEMVPAAVTLVERAATPLPGGSPRGAREWAALFALTIIAFGGEWLLRRRLGLR